MSAHLSSKPKSSDHSIYDPLDFFPELSQTLTTPLDPTLTSPDSTTHQKARGGGGSRGGKSISFPTIRIPTTTQTRLFFGSTMAALAYPHPETAEEQSPISSHAILITHVLHRGFQAGALVGAELSIPIYFYKRWKFNRPPTTGLEVVRPPPLPWRQMVLNGAAYGGIAGTALLTVGLWARMRGREEIEWQDRAWRLGGNRGQNEVDVWAVVGSVDGYLLAWYMARKETAAALKAGGPIGAGGGAAWGPGSSAPPAQGSPPWGAGGGAKWGNGLANPEAVAAAEGAGAAAAMKGAGTSPLGVGTEVVWSGWRAKLGSTALGNLAGVVGYMLYRHGWKRGKWDEDTL